MSRQLVTIRQVKELLPIEGADRIELAKIDGWQCVVKKGEFKVGDKGYYCEIDSILPSNDERFAFLEPRKFRIKSMKLRGVLSQGLLQPLSNLTDVELLRMSEGESLTDILGVEKYEPPLPISGEQVGTFPTDLVPKTDQERIQNMPDAINGLRWQDFEITEKLDGTSCTFFYRNDGTPTSLSFDAEGNPIVHAPGARMGACSRNWEMRLDDDNVYAKLWRELQLEGKFVELGRNIAIQGEIIGPRIQSNKYNKGTQKFYVFDIYDIDAGEYLNARDRMQFCHVLGLQHVPVPSYEQILAPISEELIAISDELTLDNVLTAADGYSLLYATRREGLVFKHLTDPSMSFKAISNQWLLRNE